MTHGEHSRPFLHVHDHVLCTCGWLSFLRIHIFSAMLHTLPAPLGNMLRTSARVSVWICLCLCNHDLTVQGMGEL